MRLFSKNDRFLKSVRHRLQTNNIVWTNYNCLVFTSLTNPSCVSIVFFLNDTLVHENYVGFQNRYIPFSNYKIKMFSKMIFWKMRFRSVFKVCQTSFINEQHRLNESRSFVSIKLFTKSVNKPFKDYFSLMPSKELSFFHSTSSNFLISLYLQPNL